MKNVILTTFAVAALLITSCKSENEQVKNEVENNVDSATTEVKTASN